MMHVNSTKAPLLISAYNRPGKLKACLDSVLACKDLANRKIYITLDAASCDDDELLVADCIKVAQDFQSHYLNTELRITKVNTAAAIIERTIDEILLDTQFFIAFEDDNLLHADFLKFMDYHLVKHYGDKKVFSVCGYSFPVVKNIRCDTDVFLWQGHNAWGTGYYKDRLVEFKQQTQDHRHFLENYLINIKLVWKRQRIAGHYLRSALSTYIRTKSHKDILISIYMAQNEMFNIYPKYSLVQNTGHDGSGANNKKITNKFSNDELSSEKLNIFTTPANSNEINLALRDFFTQPLKKKIINYFVYMLVVLRLILLRPYKRFKE